MPFQRIKVENSLVYSILETLRDECETPEIAICTAIMVLKRLQTTQNICGTDEEFADDIKTAFLSYSEHGKVQ